MQPSLSIVVATYRRERVLVETIEALLRLEGDVLEVLVIDQTPSHEPAVAADLDRLAAEGRVRLLRAVAPNIPAAMNMGLRLASTRIVLFVDDDVRPSPELARAHLAAHCARRAALVAGRVIQPWHRDDLASGVLPPPLWGRAGEGDSRAWRLLRKLTSKRRGPATFTLPHEGGADRQGAPGISSRDTGSIGALRPPPRSWGRAGEGGSRAWRLLRKLTSKRRGPPALTLPHERGGDRRTAPAEPRFVDEFIGCNFSLDREIALALGGFDENFARAAYRFEAEFAHRLKRAGHRLLYEPRACLHHLKCADGGSRAFSDHLRTARPDHAVGEYYCLLRTWRGWPSLRALVQRPFRAVATRHHLGAPWWIPLTLVGEATGAAWAIALALRGPRLAKPC